MRVYIYIIYRVYICQPQSPFPLLLPYYLLPSFSLNCLQFHFTTVGLFASENTYRHTHILSHELCEKYQEYLIKA